MDVNINKLMNDIIEKMNRSIESMKTDFTGIRTGKASPALVSNIIIDYFGRNLKIKEIAEIICPAIRLIVIQPYDQSTIGSIKKALSKSKIGINPISDGKIIRISIPELSKERRILLAKQVAIRAEESRVTIRNIRREGNELAKKVKKNGEITVDHLNNIL